MRGRSNIHSYGHVYREHTLMKLKRVGSSLCPDFCMFDDSCADSCGFYVYSTRRDLLVHVVNLLDV